MLIRIVLSLFICMPAIAQQQQEIKPILSDAYKRLIQKKISAGNLLSDSSNANLKTSTLTMGSYFYYNYQNGGIEKITIQNNKIKLSPLVARELIISGTYTGAINIVAANKQPLVQNEYAQGRSLNGEVVWRGAETNDLFSYGPKLSQLEYDGQPYLYDTNGKLVTKGTGKQIPANAYNNSILQNATEWKQRLVVIAELKEKQVQKYYTKLTVAQSREQLIIKHNNNSNYSVGFTGGATFLNYLKLVAGVEIQEQDFTTGNRNGFFNRVYQQSLLTPVSFSNNEGTILNGRQRSFNSINDNPLFLLEKDNPAHYYNIQTQFSAEYRFRKILLKTIYTPSQSKQENSESYRPGTVFFSAGINNKRLQKNKNKALLNNFSYSNWWGRHWQQDIAFSITNNWADVSVDYPDQPASYRWKRNTTDAALLLKSNWRNDGYFQTGFSVGNNFYYSSTATKNYLWLPTLGAYVKWSNLFKKGYLRLFVNTKKLAIEPLLTQSYTGISSLELNATDAMRFFPLKEVKSFDGLAAEQHTQYNAGFQFSYSYWLDFSATVYITNVKNALFPTHSPSGISLKNMADYRNAGIEMQFYNSIKIKDNYRNIFANTISFFLNRNIITGIDSRFDNSPIAGFSNIHKTLIKGKAVGAITGNDYLYNTNGKKIIGADGFPIAGNRLEVIGNPIPDFTMKFTQSITYNRLSFVADWEWRKGGDIWNGTRAVLDYYGRSSSSAEQRNIKGYVFDGVTESGVVNNTAVDFYNPSLPVEQNRWVRYGYSGVAKDYIEKGSFIKLNNIAFSYRIPVKWLRKLELTASASNLFIWTAYKGVDPGQVFFDQPYAEGLDFFNLPSLKRYSLSITAQF
jgi:hypothetical protein